MNKVFFYYLIALFLFALLTNQTTWIVLIALPIIVYVLKIFVWVYEYKKDD